MKTQFTVDKEFIKEAYNSACYDWKAKLKNKFPEAFQRELEVGKWYKSNLYGKKLYYFTEFKQADGYIKRYYYGFIDDLFKKDYTASTDLDNSWTLATDKEVEAALIAEAKRRGYAKNNYKCLRGETLPNCYEKMYYDKDMNELRFTNGYRYNVLFKDGKWAEICEDTKDLSIEEIQNILGYKIRIVE